MSHCEWVGVRRSFYGLKGSEEVICVGAGDISRVEGDLCN